MLGSARLRCSPAGRRGRRGRTPRSRSTRELVSRSTGSRHRRPPDRRRAVAGGVQRDGPADRHEPADADPSPGHPGTDRGRVRARRLSGCGRRSMQPEGAARRDPRGLSGRAQAHPGDRREDRHLRAVPARRRLPDEDRVTCLRDQRHGLDLAPRQAGWGGRAGHRQRGQRDRTVQARALGSRQRSEPCAERRLHPHSRRQRTGDRPLATRSGPTGVGAAGRDGRRRRRSQSIRVRDRGRRCQPRARATEGVERRLSRLHPERRPVQQRGRPPGAGPRHRPRKDRRRTVPAELRGAHPLHPV